MVGSVRTSTGRVTSLSQAKRSHAARFVEDVGMQQSTGCLRRRQTTMERPPKCKVEGCQRHITFAQALLRVMPTPKIYAKKFPELEATYGEDAAWTVCPEHIQEVRDRAQEEGA